MTTPFDPRATERPDPALMKYYLLVFLLTGPGLLIAFWPCWFKYRTLRYHFDDEGMSMRWGVLFRREIHLAYRRIQDIHLTRNLVQRWLGLATVQVQTASGGSGPEMTIEGVLDAEGLRDFLYARMRGARGDAGDTPAADTTGAPGGDDEALVLLREIRDLLRGRRS
ncbi:MAG TPA: PH domain-containing protein [Nitriliruptorales bacterium]